jgi:hypothetical protein
MDSMRNLDTSLPGTSPSKSSSSEASDLLNAFKAAAISVTTLYKTAVDHKGRARVEGYQDALDELLAFMDKEDIGLSDGEGWKIRQWATERLDDRDYVSQNMESEDEGAEKADRSSSPEIHRSHSTTRLPLGTAAPRTISPVRTGSAPPSIITPSATPTASESTNMMPPQGVFAFRSSIAYPQDADTMLSDLDLSDGNRVQNREGSVTSHVSNPPITITRPSRSSSRHNNQSGRLNNKPLGTLSRGAGQKRKINMADFFDISNSGYGKDGFGGGGKKGRFI